MTSSERQSLIDPSAFAGPADLAPSALALLELCRASLCEDDPAPTLLKDGATWQTVYELARKNSLEALSWESAQHLPEIPDGIRAPWKQSADMALYRYLMFGEERTAITDAMTTAGLAWLPLKGIVISELYPKPHLRTMCDNDILYGFVEPCSDRGWRIQGQTEEERKRTTARATKVMTEIMEKLGYTARTLHAGNADCYEKRPFFNFEMHRVIVERSLPFYEYYENPWSRAIPDSEGGSGFHFRPEDVYIYHLAHMAKHLIGSGCGLRHIVDHWMFARLKDTLDYAYLRAQSDALGLTALNQNLNRMVYALFESQGDSANRPSENDHRGENAQLNDDDIALLCHLAGNGTYGSYGNLVANRIAKVDAGSKHAVGSYLRTRLFPDDEVLQDFFPWFYRHKLARPLLPFYRIASSLRKGNNPAKRLLFEIRCIRDMQDEDERGKG